MTLTYDRTDEEEARIREWRLRASGFLPGGRKPRPMPARDAGDIVSDRQSRRRWERAEGLQVRVAELAWLLAWVDAALAGSSMGVGVDMAQFETRWLRILEFADGRTSLSASPVPAEVDPELRRELLGPDVEDLVLGYAERNGDWVLGYAGLREVDAEAFRFSLGQRSEDCRRPDREHRGGMRCLFEIRDLIDRRQRRRRGMPLAIETVENRISAARAQLRAWAAEVGAQHGS